MKKINRHIKSVLRFLILTFVLGYLLNGFAGITYANRSQSEPNLVITINKNGSITQRGNLFGSELWYPGRTEHGIIRIQNEFKRIKVEDISLEVSLAQFQKQYMEDHVYGSLLDSMSLSVSRGKMLVFKDDLIQDKKFKELLAENNNIILKGSQQFHMDKNDFVDLKYSLHMNENSGNELEAISAQVYFLIDISQNLKKE